tara:strand:- start:1981 stop:2709 length:729 start_codon:yes stop_codon:yes gene_type:complete
MNLVIDIGNTFSKVALFQSDKLVDLKVVEELTFNEIIKFVGENSPDQFILSSVREKEDALFQSLSRYFKGIRMTYSTPTPVSLADYSRETIGVDRIALLVAAYKMYPQKPALIIGCGSCITYNYLNSDGVFEGGSISPGIFMRLKAMNKFTGQLPFAKWDGKTLPVLVAKTTEGSLLAGAVNGTVYEIDEVINRYSKTLKQELNIILSGGDAKFFEKELKNSIFAHANFVLYGLNEILQFNS